MRRALLIWLALIPFLGKAQENTDTFRLSRPPFLLKTAHLELINPYQQSFALLAELPLSQRWSLEPGASLVFNSLSLAPQKGEHYKGIKWRTTLKYYLKRSARINTYLGLTFKYNDIKHDHYVNALRQGGQYNEWLLERRNLQTWGIGMRYGFQNYWGKRKKWIVEPYAGFGFRQTRIRNDALPGDAERVNEGRIFNFVRAPGVYLVPDVMWGIYMGRLFGAR